MYVDVYVDKGHTMSKLTARRVASLIKNIEERGMHGDGQGLWLQTTPPEAASWLLRTRINGKPRSIGLGSAHLIPLADAREEARRLRRIARSGGDPLAERQKETVTFEIAAQRTYQSKVPGWKGGEASTHAKQWLSSMEMYVFPKIGRRDVSSLSSSDVLAVLSPIWHEKAETARRVRQRIGTVFLWAKAAGYYSGENPINVVDATVLGKQTDKVKHHGAMAWHEVPAFVSKLNDRSALSARLLTMAILTGLRSKEARGARWEEFDTQERIWTVPGERMKGGETHRIPLSMAAIGVLAEVRELGKLFVFPSPRLGKDGAERPMSENSMLALMRRMKIDDATGHGFRTSLRTWLQDVVRADFEVAEICIAHKSGDATSQAYARSDRLDERRPIMEAWGDFVMNANQSEIARLHG